ncbi:MAG: Calx-beta domain-containing protein [bacterium]|nr:Calx-beta domain-containing protein [bacterium]
MTAQSPTILISIGDVSVVEGNSGTQSLTITLTSTAAVPVGTQVTIAVTDGTAQAGSDYTVNIDVLVYTSINATVNFIGVVQVIGDTTFEPDETFTITLTGTNNPSVGIADGEATITILNDEPSISIGDVSVVEGNSGTQNLTITLTSPVTVPLGTQVAIAVTDGTAQAGSDYTVNIDVLVYTSINATVNFIGVVQVIGDTTFEPDETFTITLTGTNNPSVGIIDGEATVTIINDDAAPPLPSVTINQASGQTDPTTAQPINFTAVFSSAIDVSTFTASDLVLTGTAGLGSASVSITEIAPNDGTTFNIAVSGITTQGTVIASLPAGAVQNITGNGSLASTSTDNAVLFDVAPFVVTSTPTQTATLPPPPATPLCEDHNFDEGGVVRSSTVDALGYAINCRVLYQHGQPTQWLGGDLYNAGSIGIQGVLDLGVQQAVDIFSPGGLTTFAGGAVFCLRGEGTLIWLAASGAPRRAAIIGSYTVPEFEGFTCATLFEPGTLVLVTNNPQ